MGIGGDGGGESVGGIGGDLEKGSTYSSEWENSSE